MRALLLGALAALTVALSAVSASAVTINPVGPINANGITLQTLVVQSTGRTYTCIWRLQGQILVPQIPLTTALRAIGGIFGAQVTCNEPGVTIQPLVGPLTSSAGPWTIALTAVLNLPNPTGALFTFLNVRFRIVDPANNFFCLFTGSIGILIQNGNPTAQLLPSTFVATPAAGDTCPAGLILTKGPGQYNLNPPIVIGP
ncbi:hypothetical protein Q5424_00230 [Conexibacter sp. JD483]|uniref:hypothetical protein n=1 Tax=unclassified Conexibacter TaxID=2627773 RepID=UPI002722E8DC|nr:MULTISPECIES: hypothetical protein [unclassified Conexibacter]MDO8184209.1 hypothetical protein [Conexibacter sp. CPCC 205706]MDO8197201.1 hypothetical protein [Conexibacter sp. CPCC 205762]MDR9367484.1 hypothetical protein [Conexibacter sp. JD483]